MNEGYPDNPIDFKRECRKYFFYLADVKQQMEKIRKLDHRMKGVPSIDLQRLRPQREDLPHDHLLAQAGRPDRGRGSLQGHHDPGFPL